jgi:alpha-glucosidase
MAPLVQATGDTPSGPLTLRVFPPASGEPCAGDLYTDDGATYDFRHGAYLRLHLTCSLTAEGALTVNIPAREGSFKPWWTQLRIEAVGLTPKAASAGAQTLTLEQTKLGYATTSPDTGKPQSITMK